MKRQFNSRSDVERYLLSEFSEYAAGDVLAAFRWAFFDGGYEPTSTKKVWTSEHRKRRRKVREAGDTTAAAELEDHLKLEEIWHKHFPKTGGRDPADYMIADWVKLGFEDLGAPVSLGVSGVEYGQPVSRFGRVVKAALNWRGSISDWRRPAEGVAKGHGPLA